jgi:magnesium transporter
MITAFSCANGMAARHALTPGAPLPPGTVWVDLAGCTSAELAQFAQLTKTRIPTLREVRLLEQTHQQFVEKGTTYLTAPLIIGSQSDQPSRGSLMFILSPHLLLTIHDAESRAISQFGERALKDPLLLQDSESAFVGLLESLLHRLADLGEIAAHELEQVGHVVFAESLQRSKAPGRGKADNWRKIMQGLGRTARLNHRLLGTLTGLDRLLAFVQSPAEPCVGEESYARLRAMQTDLLRLIEHTNAMINEATFLLDAIVGAISIEQNNVIKIFSMVAVVLMPPTMIASIYGMNFAHMPELAQPWGYPVALAAMLISAIVPWLWFKRSGWF